MSKHSKKPAAVESEDDADYGQLTVAELLRHLAGHEEPIFAVLGAFVQKTIKVQLEAWGAELKEDVTTLTAQSVVGGAIMRGHDAAEFRALCANVSKLLTLQKSPGKTKKPADSETPATINTWFRREYPDNLALQKEFPASPENIAAVGTSKTPETQDWWRVLGGIVFKSLDDDRKQKVREFRANTAVVVEALESEDNGDAADAPKPKAKGKGKGKAKAPPPPSSDSDSESEPEPEPAPKPKAKAKSKAKSEKAKGKMPAVPRYEDSDSDTPAPRKVPKKRT